MSKRLIALCLLLTAAIMGLILRPHSTSPSSDLITQLVKPEQVQAGNDVPGNHVLVVANQLKDPSLAIANYYMSKRSIPASNLLTVSWTGADIANTITYTQYSNVIAVPIFNKIKSLTDRIDYIVLVRNLPTIIFENNDSVDSHLATGDWIGTRAKVTNPYYGKTTPFSSKTYPYYLVTRLDGWSWADATALVDRSMSAKVNNSIFFDRDPTKNAGNYLYDLAMQTTYTSLTNAGKAAQIDSTNSFINPGYSLGGYFSWGSSDANFSTTAFSGLRFVPGAIAETLTGSSAKFLRLAPAAGNPSQISELVKNGVTGVKGYVSDPNIDATARPNILFSNYLNGLNLADSFYSASPYFNWKDVVLGDPLATANYVASNPANNPPPPNPPPANPPPANPPPANPPPANPPPANPPPAGSNPKSTPTPGFVPNTTPTPASGSNPKSTPTPVTPSNSTPKPTPSVSQPTPAPLTPFELIGVGIVNTQFDQTTFTVNTTLPASGTIRYGTQSGNYTSSLQLDGVNVEQSKVLTGLNPDTTYYYQATVEATGYTPITGSEGSFKTLSKPDPKHENKNITLITKAEVDRINIKKEKEPTILKRSPVITLEGKTESSDVTSIILTLHSKQLRVYEIPVFNNIWHIQINALDLETSSHLLSIYTKDKEGVLSPRSAQYGFAIASHLTPSIASEIALRELEPYQEALRYVLALIGLLFLLEIGYLVRKPHKNSLIQPKLKR